MSKNNNQLLHIIVNDNDVMTIFKIPISILCAHGASVVHTEYNVSLRARVYHACS